MYKVMGWWCSLETTWMRSGNKKTPLRPMKPKPWSLNPPEPASIQAVSRNAGGSAAVQVVSVATRTRGSSRPTRREEKHDFLP
jgi:hypothetical protein